MPFVSVCTPTFNRRPFIPIMFECFRNQTYPKSRLEWIIIDDGTDKIGDLVDAANIPQIKYFTVDKKMTLGAKRNMMHDKSRGSILVYMDDDDYYPPERISHAVESLLKNPQALCAGSSEIYLYFKNIQQGKSAMYQFGPYGPNHATAASFAFRRELLNSTRYEDHVSIAEERHFLKNYTVPFVQLDPLKTILVFSHEHNSFDKRTLLENINPRTTRLSNKTVDMFIKYPHEARIKQFFLEEIDERLRQYAPGEPRMKPDVLQQIKDIKEQREKEAIEAALKNQQQNLPTPQQIMMQQPGKDPVPIGLNDAVAIINQQQQKIVEMERRIQDLDKINAMYHARLKQVDARPPSEAGTEMFKTKIQELTETVDKLSSQVKVLLLKNSELVAENTAIKTDKPSAPDASVQKESGTAPAKPAETTRRENNIFRKPAEPLSYTDNLLNNPKKPLSKSEPEVFIRV